ncbi:hypothetical protein AB0M02_29470 [Actinoplanes sp. NPDC051861]|uniref:hypothetical protein n=1 Tax=Actinoplanes sp. NPDC051861 TaxID=3155170 RepID=UPI00342A77CF
MTPFDDPFDFGPDAGGSGGGPEQPVPARPLCRLRGTGWRARLRRRGDSSR